MDAVGGGGGGGGGSGDDDIVREAKSYGCPEQAPLDAMKKWLLFAKQDVPEFMLNEKGLFLHGALTLPTGTSSPTRCTSK